MNKIDILTTDITALEVDAIVNAANDSLLGGGGVDGAIHRAAGPALLDECRQLNGCATGSAKITQGYRLPAKFVIHAVGPVWHGGDQGEADLLASCYQTALRLASEHGAKSIAFPAISCGIYGFPIPQACTIAMREVKTYLAQHDDIKHVIFACFNAPVEDALKKAYESVQIT